MNRKAIIIDCDPGIDDAIALMLAFASPGDFDFLGITTVAGNVPLRFTEANARNLRTFCNRRDVPVYAGCPRPLVRDYIAAARVHGDKGLGGVELPPDHDGLAEQRAVDFLIDAVMARPGEITVCAVGPLTNIATVLVQEPRWADAVAELVIMGGGDNLGNVTRRAEFNFHSDPHAAHIVMTAGARVTIFGLDVTLKAPVTGPRIDAFAALGNRAGAAAAEMLRFYANSDPHLHDPCTIAYLLQPEIFSGAPCHVVVDIDDRGEWGRCDVDWRAPKDRVNAVMMRELDLDRLFTMMLERLARLP